MEIMKQLDNLDPAHMADKMLHRTALGVAIVSVAYFFSVAEFLASDKFTSLLSNIQLGLSILVLALILPTFITFTIMRSKHKQVCSEVEGYLSTMFKRACSTAFQWAFIFLISLELVLKKISIGLPPLFYIDLIIAFILGIFSIAFFMFTREEFEFEEDIETNSKSDTENTHRT